MNAAYAWTRRAPPTASVPRRALAFLVDSLVVFALAWTVTFLLATLGVLRIPDIDILGQRSPAAGLLWIVSVLESGLALVYFTAFEAAWSRTPGKMIAGLRVARLDGAKLTLYDSFLRNLLRLLWVTPFFAVFIVLDAWSLRTTELDQRIGDLAAGTLVLDARLPNV